MLTDIILIGVMCLAYGYWFNAQKTKEIALAAARNRCLAMTVQMLDDYVALNSIRLHKNKTGKIQLRRAFVFEFSSTGYERYNGTVFMLDRQIESIYMEPYRIEQTGNVDDDHYVH